MRFLSARLSAKRRSPLAGVVVLLMGLLFTGGAYAVLSPASATDELASDQALVDQGRQLFLVGCASCHGRNGEGVVTKEGTQYGPSLVGVGAAAVDFQVSTGRMPMANPGVQAPRKDPVYNEEETRAMAAYVASLGPGPAIPTPEQYSRDSIPADELEEAVVRGGEFFRTNCTACHNFNGSGGALPGGCPHRCPSRNSICAVARRMASAGDRFSSASLCRSAEPRTPASTTLPSGEDHSSHPPASDGKERA